MRQAALLGLALTAYAVRRGGQNGKTLESPASRIALFHRRTAQNEDQSPVDALTTASLAHSENGVDEYEYVDEADDEGSEMEDGQQQAALEPMNPEVDLNALPDLPPLHASGAVKSGSPPREAPFVPHPKEALAEIIESMAADPIWKKLQSAPDPKDICDHLDSGAWPGFKCWRKASGNILSMAGAYGMGIKLLIETHHPDFTVYKNCALRPKPEARALYEKARIEPTTYFHPDELYEQVPDCSLENIVDDEDEVAVFWKLVKNRGPTAATAARQKELKKEEVRGRLLGRAGVIPPVFAVFMKNADERLVMHPSMNGFLMGFSNAANFEELFLTSDFSMDLARTVKKKSQGSSLAPADRIALLVSLSKHYVTFLQHVSREGVFLLLSLYDQLVSVVSLQIITLNFQLWSWYERLWSSGILHCDAHDQNLMLKVVAAAPPPKPAPLWPQTPVARSNDHLFIESEYWDEHLDQMTDRPSSSKIFSYDHYDWIWIDPAFTTFLTHKMEAAAVEVDAALAPPCLRIHGEREEDVNNVVAVQMKMLRLVAALKRSLTARESPYHELRRLFDTGSPESLRAMILWEVEFDENLSDVLDLEEWAFRLSQVRSFGSCQLQRHIFQDDKAFAKFQVRASPPSPLYAPLPGPEVPAEVPKNLLWNYIMRTQMPRCAVSDYVSIARTHMTFLEQQRQRLMRKPWWRLSGNVWPDFPPPNRFLSQYSALEIENKLLAQYSAPFRNSAAADEGAAAAAKPFRKNFECNSR